MAIETFLTDPQYQQCQIIAKARARKPRSKRFSKLTDAQAHMVGLVGEFAFASVAGLKVDTSTGYFGDGGVDFKVGPATIQIKTRRLTGRYKPDLLVKQGQPKCEYYVLCEWDAAIPKIVNIVGWCYHSELIRKEKDLGYGDTFYVNREDLRDSDELIRRLRQYLGTQR